jgi:hypothetical protein
MIVIAKSEEHLELIKSELIKCLTIIRSDPHLDEESLAFIIFLNHLYTQKSARILCDALKKSLLDEHDTIDDVTHYYCHNSHAKSYFKLKLKYLLAEDTQGTLTLQFNALKMAVLKL